MIQTYSASRENKKKLKESTFNKRKLWSSPDFSQVSTVLPLLSLCIQKNNNNKKHIPPNTHNDWDLSLRRASFYLRFSSSHVQTVSETK